MMPREDNYYEIISLFLSGYHCYCRNKFFNTDGKAEKWLENEDERAWAHESNYDPHKSPVEQLMLEVVSIILEAKRGSAQFVRYKKEVINGILKEHELAELLQALLEDEELEFKTDLWLCGFYKGVDVSEIDKMLQLIHKPFIPLLKKSIGLSLAIEDCLTEGGQYDEITTRLVEYYYYYCRIKLASNNYWLKGEWELYYAYYQLQPVFTTPLEQLILEAALLILDAGRSPLAFQEIHRERVRKLLECHDFMSIAIEKLPEIGARELASDLSSLGFWNYKKFSERLESHYS